MINILQNAINSVQQSKGAYCKFLSANDTKATGGHQSGFLIGKAAARLFLGKSPRKGKNVKVDVTINWQDGVQRNCVVTYYGAAKDELRLTNFGRNFPFREEDNVGDLLVISKIDTRLFDAYLLSHDEQIEQFLSAVGITASQTNNLIVKTDGAGSDTIQDCFDDFIRQLVVDFPPGVEIARHARMCFNKSLKSGPLDVMGDPDKFIVSWLESEYRLFKSLENASYGQTIKKPFGSVDELVRFANIVLNRRKSRAGYSLEYHLLEMFDIFNLEYAYKPKTEEEKEPDFIFPSEVAYHNRMFSEEKLVFLASKTTCKDRWRQILNEADRIRSKHLFTLQQGISPNQLREMTKSNVQLVVPKQYLGTFPSEFRPHIMTLQTFIKFVQETQT